MAFLATDMVEQVELTEPWKAVQDEGVTPEVVSLEEGEILGFNHYDKADTFKVDRTVEEASAEDYDALVVCTGELVQDAHNDRRRATPAWNAARTRSPRSNR